MPRISINLVTWNNLKFLPQCLDSIFKQTFNNFSVLAIDNASNDGTVKFIENNYPQVAILKNARNLGFSKAHNQGIKFAVEKEFDYILVINPDIILNPDCLLNLVQAIESDEKIASVGPKLFKIQSGNIEIGENIKTDIIDSCGLKIIKSRRVADRGSGEIGREYYKNEEEVFGISGSLVLYRRKALEDIKIAIQGVDRSVNAQSADKIKNFGRIGEYFDEDFFAYKEDIDMAWRLRINGWKNFYYPKAIAFHYRTASMKEKVNSIVIIKNRKKSEIINYHSYKNHLMLLAKNEFFSNFILNFPYIIFYEFKKIVYILFFEARTLKALKEFFGKLPKILKKRAIIMKNRKIKAREIRGWFK